MIGARAIKQKETSAAATTSTCIQISNSKVSLKWMAIFILLPLRYGLSDWRDFYFSCLKGNWIVLMAFRPETSFVEELEQVKLSNTDEDDKMYDNEMIYGCRYCNENATNFHCGTAIHDSHAIRSHRNEIITIVYTFISFSSSFSSRTTSENWLWWRYHCIHIPHVFVRNVKIMID